MAIELTEFFHFILILAIRIVSTHPLNPNSSTSPLSISPPPIHHKPIIRNRSIAPQSQNAQSANSENGVDQAAVNEELVQTIRRVREAAAVAEKLEKEKETAQDKKFEVKVELPSDQDGQATETDNKSAALDELTLDNDNDDENRDKRWDSSNFQSIVKDGIKQFYFSSDSFPLAAVLQLVHQAVVLETSSSTLSE